jgi:hypothetical protein
LEETTRPLIGSLVCLTNTTGIAFKSKKNTVEYPNFLSAVRHVAHSEDLAVPKPPENLTSSDDDISTMDKWCQGKYSRYMPTDYCWSLRRHVQQAKYSRK